MDIKDLKPVTPEFIKNLKFSEEDLKYFQRMQEDEERSALFLKEYGDKLIVGGPVDEWIKAHEEFEKKHPRKY